MSTEDSPVATLSVPLAFCAKAFTTQLEGKPFTSTGGPKKQVASAWQPPGVKQSPSVVHSAAGVLTQGLTDPCGPPQQCAGLVPRLPVSVVPSGLSRIVVAFSGMTDGFTVAVPPPM